MNDDNLADLVRRRVSLASMIDNGAHRDCIPAHQRARLQAQRLANRRLREAMTALAAVRTTDRADYRREAEKVHQGIRDGFGYNLLIHYERDGSAHFGDVGENTDAPRYFEKESTGRGSSFNRGSGISLTDVFKR